MCVVLTLVAVGELVMDGVVVVVMVVAVVWRLALLVWVVVAMVVVVGALFFLWWRLLTLECLVLPMLRWLCITEVLATRWIAELQLHNTKTIQN